MTSVEHSESHGTLFNNENKHVKNFPLLPSPECDEHRRDSECFSTDSNKLSPVLNQFPLFQLPGELRRMIYWWSIVVFRSPCTRYIYADPRAAWKDRPSPLLSTSKQVRAEVIDLLRLQKLFPLRLTRYGPFFDKLSLSSMIAQGLQKSYRDLPALQIEIWPSYDFPSRRKKTLSLFRSLRGLRDELRRLERIPALTICFMENECAKWSVCGKAINILDIYSRRNQGDIEVMLCSFKSLRKLEHVRIQLPPTLRLNERLKIRVWKAISVMEADEGKDTDASGDSGDASDDTDASDGSDILDDRWDSGESSGDSDTVDEWVFDYMSENDNVFLAMRHDLEKKKRGGIEGQMRGF